MTRQDPENPRRTSLRPAAIGALAFALLFAIHHLLQGAGPASSAPADVAAYNVAHRGAILGSEVAVGLGLLAFIVLLGPLVTAIREAGQEPLAVATQVAGAAFVTLGFMSTAAETALAGVADTGGRDAVDALNQLQGRTPVVWAVTALVTTVSLAILRTGMLWRWLGNTGLVLAVIFVLASISSLVGRDVEGGYSLIGVGLFIAWTLALAAALWRVGSAVAQAQPAQTP